MNLNEPTQQRPKIESERVGVGPTSDLPDIAHLAPRGPRSCRWAMQLRFCPVAVCLDSRWIFPLLQRSTAFATLPSKLALAACGLLLWLTRFTSSSNSMEVESHSPKSACSFCLH